MKLRRVSSPPPAPRAVPAPHFSNRIPETEGLCLFSHLRHEANAAGLLDCHNKTEVWGRGVEECLLAAQA